MVSRSIAVCGLCVTLVLSACGQASSGTNAADVVAASPSATVAPGTGTLSGTPQTVPTGTLRSPGGATPAEQTHPQITPKRGGPRTVFVVRLTSRQRLSAQGAVAAMYRLGATAPPKRGCDREVISTIDRGAVGQRLRVVLRPGRLAWCRGDWRGVVYLLRGPRCAQGSAASRSRCPEFASQLIEVGRLRWQVR
jgi:hypothetical protein